MTNLFHKDQYQTPLLEDSITPWMGPLAPWARHDVRVYNDDRARNWFIGAVIVSMVLHIVLFVIPWPKKEIEMPPLGSAGRPVSVHFESRRPRAEVKDDKDVKQKPTPAPPQPAVVTSRRPPTPERPTVPPPPPVPVPVKPTPAPPAPPEDDFATALKKRRAARGETDPSLAGGPSGSDAEDSDSPEARAKANVQAALDKASNTKGINGMFSIMKVGVCTAQVKFIGRHVGTGELLASAGSIPGDIDVCPGGDVRAAIVKKELEYIHRYYKGDFKYESVRFGRFIPMSGSPEHASELEAFVAAETDYVLDHQTMR